MVMPSSRIKINQHLAIFQRSDQVIHRKILKNGYVVIAKMGFAANLLDFSLQIKATQ